MEDFLPFYLSGTILGVGICTLHCSLLLAPLVARININWKEGLQTAALFGAGKVLICALYGLIAALTGELLDTLVGETVLSFFGGIVLALMGIWFLFSSGRSGRIIKRGSPFLLGITDGLVPCGPLLGFVVYIISAGLTPAAGTLAGLLFGLGTMTGPVLVVCGVVPWLWRWLKRIPHAALGLRIVGTLVFFGWGIVLILP